jgi:hypothetical protein
MHSLTDLTAIGDLKAFLNARHDLPDREAFDSYAGEANRYYPTVTYFGSRGKTARRCTRIIRRGRRRSRTIAAPGGCALWPRQPACGDGDRRAV